MEGQERREHILKLLQTSTEAISGSQLAKMFGVSRQVIVQDIALLRAVNKNILSTARGYLLYCRENQKVNRCFPVWHNTSQIKEELYCIVDLGGKMLDVIVSHPIYGTISADLVINNRKDADEFVRKVEEKQTIPLKELTNDFHFHTVEADTIEQLDAIELALKNAGYLVTE